MRPRSSILLLVMALVVAGSTVTATAATSRLVDCLRAEDFGAVPNDGKDDRVQLQAAIDAAQAGPGCLSLGPGRFHATRQQIPGANGIPSLKITAPLTFRGAGATATTLAMLGPGTCSGCPSPNPTDWHLLDVTGGATDVTVSDLTFDGSQRVNTQEQTHLVQLTGPTRHVVIERARFALPSLGGSTGGDCIRLLGTPANRVQDTTIRDTVGVNCDRSFVGVQRGVDGLLVERSESVVVGDQAIDFEPSGAANFAPEPIVKNVLIRQVTLRRGPAAQGANTVTIAGDTAGGLTAPAQNVTLTDSVIEDGGVFVMDADDVTLSGLNLRSRPGLAQAPVLARNQIRNLRVLDTTIERLAASGPGSAIRIAADTDSAAVDALLSGIHVTQATTGPLVHTTKLARLAVSDAQLDYTGPAQDECAVVAVGTPEQRVERTVLTDVTVTGPLACAARVGGPNPGPLVLIRVTGP